MSPITHTSRKGFVYFLNRGVTKTGKPRYYFAREAKGEPVEQIPEGYEIDESVNGIVSLVKVRPQLILLSEIEAVQVALKQHPKKQHYRVVAKQDKIIIYEGSGAGIDLEQLQLGAETLERMQIELERYAQFTQVMRFILEDEEQRIFRAERWCYRGRIDDWIYAGASGTMDDLAPKLVPALGTDDFYELF
jgi:hypothetical protein